MRAEVLTALHVAGVRLELRHSAAALSPWRASLAPFTSEPAGPIDARLQVSLTVDPALHLETIGPAAGSHFCYQRTDVRLELDAARIEGRAVVDGTRGSLGAVVELALQAALLPLDGLLAHAAAGVVGEAGWLVPGPSGAGKSTVARGAGFDRVLTDEMVAVRRRTDGFWLWGTPFWSEGRTRPFDGGCAPLDVLARPVKATRLAVESWPTEQAACGLLACVALYEDWPAARAQAFDLACEIASAARCVSLEFPKEGPWARAAAARI